VAGGRRRARRLWLINRLDSATSGLILAAADEALAREVRAQFQRRQVRKVYQALVFGVPRKPSETWRDVLDVRKAGRPDPDGRRGRQPARGEQDDAGAHRAGARTGR
jgi:tRNA pseudouridine65 synthase